MAVEAPEKKARYLHVKVIDELKEGHPVVNIKVPAGLVKFGLKMAQTFSPEMRDAQVDWEAVSEMVDDKALGEIVHVEDEQQHKTIDVWLE
jgi:hypothetical protein